MSFYHSVDHNSSTPVIDYKDSSTQATPDNPANTSSLNFNFSNWKVRSTLKHIFLCFWLQKNIFANL